MNLRNKESEMDKNKSRRYTDLVEKVKQKYRNYPVCANKLELGWCDLLPAEDLCREINLWTYWQGWGYAKDTPHIKYMLIGQDFGPPEKEETKGTIANVREMNKGNAIMFHKDVKLEGKDSQTDNNLIQYFGLLGRPKIDEKRYSDLFFCNCNLGYRKGNYSGNMTRRVLENDSREMKELVDILQPENIICLGLETSVVMIRTLIDARFSCNNFSGLIGDGAPYQYGDTYIYPVAHPGYWGTMNRGVGNVEKDWMRIRK